MFAAAAAEGSAPACWSSAVTAELPAGEAAEALTCSPSGGVWARGATLQPPWGPASPHWERGWPQGRSEARHGHGRPVTGEPGMGGRWGIVSLPCCRDRQEGDLGPLPPVAWLLTQETAH